MSFPVLFKVILLVQILTCAEAVDVKWRTKVPDIPLALLERVEKLNLSNDRYYKYSGSPKIVRYGDIDGEPTKHVLQILATLLLDMIYQDAIQYIIVSAYEQEFTFLRFPVEYPLLSIQGELINIFKQRYPTLNRVHEYPSRRSSKIIKEHDMFKNAWPGYKVERRKKLTYYKCKNQPGTTPPIKVVAVGYKVFLLKLNEAKAETIGYATVILDKTENQNTVEVFPFKSASEETLHNYIMPKSVIWESNPISRDPSLEEMTAISQNTTRIVLLKGLGVKIIRSGTQDHENGTTADIYLCTCSVSESTSPESKSPTASKHDKLKASNPIRTKTGKNTQGGEVLYFYMISFADPQISDNKHIQVGKFYLDKLSALTDADNAEFIVWRKVGTKQLNEIQPFYTPVIERLLITRRQQQRIVKTQAGGPHMADDVNASSIPNKISEICYEKSEFSHKTRYTVICKENITSEYFVAVIHKAKDVQGKNAQTNNAGVEHAQAKKAQVKNARAKHAQAQNDSLNNAHGIFPPTNNAEVDQAEKSNLYSTVAIGHFSRCITSILAIPQSEFLTPLEKLKSVQMGMKQNQYELPHQPYSVLWFDTRPETNTAPLINAFLNMLEKPGKLDTFKMEILKQFVLNQPQTLIPLITVHMTATKYGVFNGIGTFEFVTYDMDLECIPKYFFTVILEGLSTLGVFEWTVERHIHSNVDEAQESVNRNFGPPMLEEVVDVL